MCHLYYSFFNYKYLITFLYTLGYHRNQCDWDSMCYIKYNIVFWNLWIALTNWLKCLTMMMCKVFIFCLKIFFFFGTGHKKLYKYLKCFSEDKICTIYRDHPIQKVYTPQAQCLMHCVTVFSKYFHLIYSYVWVPQLSSVWKDGSQNHAVTFGKGSNLQKKLENQRMCRSWKICLNNSECSGPTRDSWTTITKQKDSRGSSRKWHAV